MYLNIPTNWDNELVDIIAIINSNDLYTYKIGQVYGSCLTNIGSGRLDTPAISVDRAKEHIKNIQQQGIKFNFLINAPSLAGKEHDRRYRAEIINTLHWINNLGVDIVTVSIPFLGELINLHFPNLLVKMSTILDVRTIQGVDMLEELGPNIYGVTVSRFINRDFELIKQMVLKAPYNIELLANSLCLLNCPYQKYHGDLVCWYAKIDRGWEEPFTDYRTLGCDKIRLNNLSQVIKSPWIRPEDLEVYAKLGIDSIKIAGRTFPSDILFLIIKAYASGNHSGNLWDLIAPHLPIYIDNNKLNGFIDFFTTNPYRCNSSCGECTYCDEVAKESVFLTKNAKPFLIDLNKRLEARLDNKIIQIPYLSGSIL